MHYPHNSPNHIFTTYLDLSHIFFSKSSSEVGLLGCYGNMLNLEMESISIETDFATLNDLLAVAGPEAEGTIEQLSKLLSEPTSENMSIDLCDYGGIHLHEHIFALMMIDDNDEESELDESKEDKYAILAYTPLDNLIPEFIDWEVPVTPQDRAAYIHSLLILKYKTYLTCRKKHDESTSLIMSDLTNPLLFNLAEAQYDILTTNQPN
ncbi:MAG: hypothetical protein ACXVBZ_08900 [Flavisolibacter sp.]